MELNERERAFENKYAHDQELHFKVRAKRNKLAGLWAAEKLGKSGDDAAKYAADLVSTGITKDNLKERLQADFSAAGVSINDKELDAQIMQFVAESRRHFMN